VPHTTREGCFQGCAKGQALVHIPKKPDIRIEPGERVAILPLVILGEPLTGPWNHQDVPLGCVLPAILIDPVLPKIQGEPKRELGDDLDGICEPIGVEPAIGFKSPIRCHGWPK